MFVWSNMYITLLVCICIKIKTHTYYLVSFNCNLKHANKRLSTESELIVLKSRAQLSLEC